MTNNLNLIVAAGGSSVRFGEQDKLLEMLGDLPVFLHCIRNFAPLCKNGRIVVAVRQEALERYRQLTEKFLPETEVIFVPGGVDRCSSVCNALAALPDDDGLVAVHDAARPLASAALLRRVAAQAEISGGAIAAVKVVDSLKRVDASNCVLEPVSRDDLYRAETPQVFDIGKIRQAYRQADRSGVTDDAEIMRRAGFTVEVVDSGEFNLKLTRLFDLEMLKIFFAAGN